jgi:protein SCO1
MKLTRRGKSAVIAFVLFDLALAVILLDLFQLSASREAELELRELGATIYPEPRPLSDFELRDQFGNSFTANDFLGGWSLVFFGFTSCPDICPLTMAELKQFYRALEVSETDKPRIILVTVDPARDTPEAMANYLDNYNENFIGLSGDVDSISNLATQLYVAQSGGPYDEAAGAETAELHNHTEDSSTPGSTSDYLINHSAHISVISPQGENFAVMRPPHRDQDILKAFQLITKH